MTNEKILELSRKSDFRNKIEAGIVLAATQINAEDSSSMVPIVALKRHQLAYSVLINSQKLAISFSLPCAAQPGLNDKYDENLAYIGTNEDNDINFTISSVWNHMAGLSYADINS